jgi:hypothetical protein
MRDWFATTGILRPSDPLKALEPLNVVQKALIALIRRMSWYQEDDTASKQNLSGRIITLDRSGHLFNQHYIQPMFEMDTYGQAVMESNVLMDSLLAGKDKTRPQAPPGTTKRGVSRAPKSTMSMARYGHGGDADLLGQYSDGAGDLRIKDVSRLWQYRNGESPSTRIDTRMGTL